MILQPATKKPNAILLAALMLVAGLAAGFVVGQAAPDVLGGLSAGATIDRDATVQSPVTAPLLGPNDDYGTRHGNAAIIGSGPVLTDLDDWALRHRPAPAPTAVPLTRNDDYGTRHGGGDSAP